MNPSDPATDFITRRDFMKKSALTVGAITLLSQGIGLASGTGGGSSYYVQGNPAGKVLPTEADNYVHAVPLTVHNTVTGEDVTYNAKIATLATPANATHPSIVKISVALQAWIDGGSLHSIPAWTLEGEIVGDFFSTLPTDQLTALDNVIQPLPGWRENEAIAAGDIEDRHWIEAQLLLVYDNPMPTYREIRCTVSLVHYRQEYVMDTHNVMIPHSFPVEIDATFPIPLVMYVSRMP